MLGLGWLIYFSFGMVASSLVPVITLVRNDLNISLTQMGMVLGAWQLVYIGAAAPAGMLIDRIGPKRALAVGALIITVSAFLRSYATGFGTLFAAVALFGVGGPIVSIGLPKLIADWFIGPKRGLASGIYITGSSLGSVVVLSLTHSLILPLTGSWQASLAVYAAVALGVTVLWTLLGRDSPQSLADRRPAGAAREGGGLREVIFRPEVWTVVLVGFAGFFAGHGLRNWLPQILEARGMTPAIAGFLGALPAMTGILGSVIIVRAASRRPGNRKTVTIAMLLTTGASLAAIVFTDGWLLVTAIAMEGFCAFAVTPLMLNTMMELPSVGARNMGTAAGIFFTVGEVGGTLGPFLLGLTADMTGSFTLGMFGMAAVMWVMVIPALRLRS